MGSQGMRPPAALLDGIGRPRAGVAQSEGDRAAMHPVRRGKIGWRITIEGLGVVAGHFNARHRPASRWGRTRPPVLAGEGRTSLHQGRLA